MAFASKPGFTAWLSELGRRNVLRIAAAYLALAWLLLQVAATLVPILALPAWTQTLTLWLLGLGLAPTLLLAWMFEWTPQGPVRDRGGRSPRRRYGARHSAPATDEEGDRLRRVHRMDLAIIGVLLVALGFSLWQRPPAPVAEPVDTAAPLATPSSENVPRRVLVLPFNNLGDNTADEHFTDGLSEELMHALAALPELAVLARGTSFALREQAPQELTDLGARFELDWVVEGTVRRSGDVLRITARLVDASSGVQRWSQAFDRGDTDALRVQSEVAAAIARELGLQSGPTPTPIAASARAQRLFLEARSLDRSGATLALQSARSKLREAIEDSPEFLAAQLLAAVVEIRLQARDGISYQAARQRLIELLQVMQAKAPDSAETAAVRGFLNSWLAPSNFRRSEAAKRAEEWRALQRALPHNTYVQILLAWEQLDLGDVEAAHRELAEAVQIDPLDGMARANLNNAFSALGRYEDALAISRSLLHERSPYSNVRATLAEMEASRGRYAEAHALLADCIEQAQTAQCILNLAANFNSLDVNDLALRCFEPGGTDNPQFPGARPLVDFLLVHESSAFPPALADALLNDIRTWRRFSPYLAAELLARGEFVTVLELYSRAHPELVESPPPALTASALGSAVLVARALQLDGRPAQAEALITRALDARAAFSRTPFPFNAHHVVALALLGRHDEALTVLQELERLG